MIGDIIHEQGNYKETVIAEKDNIQLIDCSIDGSTLLLRIEPTNRLHDPFTHKIVYNSATVQTILDHFKAIVNEVEFKPPHHKRGGE
jgi:hypothetical protein